MTNRGKPLINNKSQNDDDNCSVICYKDSNDGHVGVVRIRQQPVCSACNLMRGTLSLYYKHIVDNNHRENVKKLCDENRFVPTVYDQAIHLAFQNNFYYQSEKFHFLYKHTNEEPENLSPEKDKMEINNNNNDNQQKTTPTNTRKRRNIQVTLVFQDKTYSQIGTAVPQIREQLLKDMLTDRANDINALPMEIYYTKKKIAPDDIHHNAQKGSIILTMVKDQSQDMLKKQHHQEPFENGHISSAEISRENNGVEQNNVITTHEISATEKLDVDEQSSFVDDVMNVCKDVLNNIIIDTYSKTDEFKREQQFLSGIARRNFKKKNTYFCDICSIFLTSEKYCIQHLNGSDHLEKIRNYQTNFLPWRQAMQKSLITGKSIKEIMGNTVYDNYKATMALYLAPNSLSSRGRFCCAYCELIFTDQWSLEKHLHTSEHKDKQTSTDHKELVVRFANVAILPIIFKLNGIIQLSEVPEDIKTRYQWRCVTRAQLDDDISSFIRNYPFDTFEGATRILNGRAARKQKSSAAKPTPQNLRNNTGNNNNNNHVTSRNQQGRRNGFNRARGGQFQIRTPRQGTAMKRPLPATVPSNKRFRPDLLNTSFPGVNHGSSGPVRNYDTEQYGYNRQMPYNNGNDRWPTRYPVNHHHQQQRQESFERSNFELRSLASDNNGYNNNSRPPHHMSGENNYNYDRQQPHFNNGSRGYDNQQSNYNPNFMHNNAQSMGGYHPEQNPISLGGPPNRSYHRTNTGPSNDVIHHTNNNNINNNFQRPQHQHQQQQPPPMGQMHHQNQSSFGGFAINNSNNNNANSSFFPSSNNQQPNQMGSNGSSIHSYADYQASSGLSAGNNHSSMYQPLPNTQNSVIPQSRTFDEFGLSSLTQGPSNPYGRSGGLSFGNGEPRHNNFGHQNQMEQPSQTSWRGSTRGGNNTRGRGGGGGHFQTMNKQPGSTFSYSSSNNNNNNNNNNNSTMRGRGAGRNARNFGSRR